MYMLYDYESYEEEEQLLVRIGNASLQLCWKQSSLTLRASKAARYLVELLLHPYQPISAVALHALVNHALPAHSGTDDLGYLPDSVNTSFHNLLPQPLCDAETIRSVKQRLNRVLARLAEAKQWHDLAGIEALQQERDDLLAYLQTCLSPLGSAQRESDPDYKCRDNVYQSLRQLLSRIRRHCPELGDLLQKSLRLWSELVFIPAGNFSVIVLETKQQNT
jgi:hypothetical protein